MGGNYIYWFNILKYPSIYLGRLFSRNYMDKTEAPSSGEVDGGSTARRVSKTDKIKSSVVQLLYKSDPIRSLLYETV